MWYRMSLMAPFDLKISADCHGKIVVNLLYWSLLLHFFFRCEVPYYIFTVLGLPISTCLFLSLSFNFFAVMEKNQQLQMLDTESTVQYIIMSCFIFRPKAVVLERLRYWNKMAEIYACCRILGLKKLFSTLLWKYVL
jgi:hypothetical protein